VEAGQRAIAKVLWTDFFHVEGMELLKKKQLIDTMEQGKRNGGKRHVTCPRPSV